MVQLTVRLKLTSIYCQRTPILTTTSTRQPPAKPARHEAASWTIAPLTDRAADRSRRWPIAPVTDRAGDRSRRWPVAPLTGCSAA